MGKDRRELKRKKVEVHDGPAKFIKIIGEERGENSSGGEGPTEKATPAKETRKELGNKDQRKEYSLLDGLSKKWDFLKARKQGELAIG